MIVVAALEGLLDDLPLVAIALVKREQLIHLRRGPFRFVDARAEVVHSSFPTLLVAPVHASAPHLPAHALPVDSVLFLLYNAQQHLVFLFRPTHPFFYFILPSHFIIIQ